MTDQLDQLTDAELSEVFAVGVAGYSRFAWKDKKGRSVSAWAHKSIGRYIQLPDFSTSADAALSHARIGLRIKRTAAGWTTDLATEHGIVMGDDAVLGRAICKTLIRAKRAEKGQP